VTESDSLKKDYAQLWAVANSEELLDAAVAEREGKLLAEVDRLKRDLGAARQESERWYSAFLDVSKERDLLRKELRTVR
jgi:hypothetical protein